MAATENKNQSSCCAFVYVSKIEMVVDVRNTALIKGSICFWLDIFFGSMPPPRTK